MGLYHSTLVCLSAYSETKPVPKPHFAALTKTVRQVPVFRDANAPKPAEPAISTAVKSTSVLASKPKRAVLGSVGNQRADGPVKFLPVGKAGLDKGKGKGTNISEQEEDMEAKVCPVSFY